MRGRSLAGAALAITIAGITAGAVAWACVPVATLNVSPGQARAGQEVTLTGNFYNSKPVVVRFNALDGPVVGTIQPIPQPGGTSSVLNGRVAIPADAKPGNYTLIAFQEADVGRTTWGIPSRVLVTVVGDGGAPVSVAPMASNADTARPAGLAQGDEVSSGELALVGLGVAGAAMFVAGMAAFFAGRRRPAAEAVPSGR